MSKKIYTIRQISQYISNTIDAEELLHSISISGEVSNLSIVDGTAYFVIKDNSAKMDCIFFGAGNQLDGVLNGDSVILTGTPRFYLKNARLSFHVKQIEQSGVGDLYKKFLALKEKLQKEGLFEKKKPMPDNIRRIGVITSPTGAVIQDIINVSSRRDSGVDIVIYPVRVQGIEAESDICNAISFFNDYDKIDCILIARGGGSLEDLNAFNTESVARAVANCKKFVASGVGHETDFTLCDFSSDLRAPTPSAAAELLTKDLTQKKRDCLSLLMQAKSLLNRLYENTVNKFRYLSSKINSVSRLKISYLEKKSFALAEKLNSSITALKYRTTDILEKRIITLEYLNPLKILKQGYAKIFNTENIEISSKRTLELDSEIKIHFHDGIAKARVIEIDNKKIK